MSLTNNLLRFSQSLKLMLGAFMVCAVAFGYYGTARNAIRTANAARYASVLLMQELQQSSDDLTRMVRTYVITGDRRYREQFNEILAIRDGFAPRPEQYEKVYWDLVLDERRPTPGGETSALLQRMSIAGFTGEEMNRLAVAKQNSDLLVDIEQQAMNLVESDSITPEQRLQAARMLNDDRYHRAKADIMRPIAETSRMVDARTAATVTSAERRALSALAVFVLSGAVALLTLWWTRRNLQRVFGGSVSQLRAAVISTANTDVPAVVAGNGDMDSIIGKLVDAQQIRINDEVRRRDAERTVSESERRLRSIVGALDDGVCVVQDALIRFVNRKLQEILEKPEVDLVDHPFIQFVHNDDRIMLMELFRKGNDNTAAERVSEFRVCAGPSALRRIVSRASQFEWAGRPATLYFINMVDNVGAK